MGNSDDITYGSRLDTNHLERGKLRRSDWVHLRHNFAGFFFPDVACPESGIKFARREFSDRADAAPPPRAWVFLSCPLDLPLGVIEALVLSDVTAAMDIGFPDSAWVFF